MQTIPSEEAKTFCIVYEPVPLSLPNIDFLSKLETEAEMPIRVILVEAPDESAALAKVVNDDTKRCIQNGLISVIKAWEELR